MGKKILQINPQNGIAESTRFWPDWQRLKRRGLVILAILLLTYIGLNVWVSFWIQGKVQEKYPYRPDFIDYTKTFWDTTLNFPKEWRDIEKVFHGLDREEKHLKNAWNRIGNQERFLPQSSVSEWNRRINDPNQPLTSQDWKDFKTVLETYDAFLESGKKYLTRMDEELQKIPPGNYLPDFFENHSYFYHLRELITLKVIFLAHEGKASEAFKLRSDSLLLHIYNPIHTYGSYASAHFSLWKYLPNMRSLIDNIWDEDFLRSRLDWLNRLEPYLFRVKEKYEHLYGPYSSLCYENIPVYYGKDVKVRDYVRAMKDARFPPKGAYQTYSKVFNNWFVGSKWLKYERQIPEIEILRPFVFTRAIEEYYMFQTYLSDSRGYLKHDQQTGVLYDELRLTIAAKLYNLKNNKFPATAADLAPAYFPEEIRNRRDGSAYRWNQNGRLLLGRKK